MKISRVYMLVLSCESARDNGGEMGAKAGGIMTKIPITSSFCGFLKATI